MNETLSPKRPVTGNPTGPVVAHPAPVLGQGGGTGPGSGTVAPATLVSERMRFWRRMAVVLGGFVVVLASLMIWGQVRINRVEPWTSPTLMALREQLHADPKNEALKTEYRQVDHALREAYFVRLERQRTGAWLLLLVGGGWVWALKQGWRPAPARPWTTGTSDRRYRVARARAITGVVGGGILLAMVISGLWTSHPLEAWERQRALAEAEGTSAAPEAPGAASTTGAVAVAVADPGAWMTEAPHQWPRFLGHQGNNQRQEARIPLQWDVAAGTGVIWRSEVPRTGYSSPVVWKDHLFVTGGNRQGRRMFAYATADGRLLWEQAPLAPGAPEAAIRPPEMSGAAACTPATDGERVYAIFGTGELAAWDFAGTPLWQRRLDVSDNSYGHAASLVVWQDRLLLQMDQGHEEDGRSELLALDVRTGQTVWSVKRPVGGSWTTPWLGEAGGRWQLILAGDPWLMAYDPTDGAELWRARVLGGELAPSPMMAGGLVVAVCPGVSMAAVRPDGTGDVTETHTVWKVTKDMPDVPTPVAWGDWFFTANTEGHVIAWESATGRKVWEHEFEVEIQASPLLLGDRLYLFGQPGNVWVLQAGGEYRLLAEFDMGEEIYASPAVTADRLWIRSAKAVLAIGEAAVSPEEEVADGR